MALWQRESPACVYMRFCVVVTTRLLYKILLSFTDDILTIYTYSIYITCIMQRLYIYIVQLTMLWQLSIIERIYTQVFSLSYIDAIRSFSIYARTTNCARRIFENIICMCCRALFLTLNAVWPYSTNIEQNIRAATIYTNTNARDCRGAMQMNQNMRTIAMMLYVLVCAVFTVLLTNNTLVCIANSMVKS